MDSVFLLIFEYFIPGEQVMDYPLTFVVPCLAN